MTLAAGFLFEIAVRGGMRLGLEKLESEPRRKIGDELFVGVGSFGSPMMVEVGDARHGAGRQMA
jgi:hypothetical protein